MGEFYLRRRAWGNWTDSSNDYRCYLSSNLKQVLASPHFPFSQYVFLDFSLNIALMWSRPSAGFVNINVHAVSYKPPLPNGNTTGVRIVIRDDDVLILAIVRAAAGLQNRQRRYRTGN